MLRETRLRPTRLRRRRRRTTGRFPVLVAAAAALLAPAIAVPASAHDSIVGSVPADGAVVTTAPSEVRITFEEPPTAAGLGVAVTAPGGASVVAGRPTVAGNVVVQELDPLTVGGDYTVSYRVVSEDGHPVSGTFAFTYDAGSASPGASTPTAGTPTDGSPSQTLAESSSALPGVEDTSGTDLTPWVIAGSVVLLVGVVLGGLALRRRSA